MKKVFKKMTAYFLVLVMVCAVFLEWMPPIQALAETSTKTMAHLKAGTSNGNSHFGGTTPEAFVLSEKSDITSEDFSVTLKLVSEASDSRVRIVTKYVDDSNWSYIGFDRGSGWFVEFNDNGTSSWQDLSGLPSASAGDILEISGSYGDSGLAISVTNTTTGSSGTTTATAEHFLALKDQEGRIGFGAGSYGGAVTDFYFSDVTIGSTALAGADFSPYASSAAGYTWTEAEEVGIGGEDSDDDEDDAVDSDARKWIVLQGGANNSGGHNYGNAASKGPIAYMDNSKAMESGGTLSLALKPSNNWGVFYSYIDDSNWLYVGWDSSSNWYYQYKINGSESYPKISGLPELVEGEEMSLSLSLNNETLAVDVNGTTVYVTNQALKSYAEELTQENGNLGRFGVMTKGQTTIKFADVTYNSEDCMDDAWGFCAERDGQIVEEEITAVGQ